MDEARLVTVRLRRSRGLDWTVRERNLGDTADIETGPSPQGMRGPAQRRCTCGGGIRRKMQKRKSRAVR